MFSIQGLSNFSAVTDIGAGEAVKKHKDTGVRHLFRLVHVVRPHLTLAHRALPLGLPASPAPALPPAHQHARTHTHARGSIDTDTHTYLLKRALAALKALAHMHRARRTRSQGPRLRDFSTEHPAQACRLDTAKTSLHFSPRPHPSSRACPAAWPRSLRQTPRSRLRAPGI